MAEQSPVLRDFIYLDYERVRSVAAQLGAEAPASAADEVDRAARERLFLHVEPALLERQGSAAIGPDFDFARWSPEAFSDGQFVRATGTVRLLDYSWLAMGAGRVAGGAEEDEARSSSPLSRTATRAAG